MQGFSQTQFFYGQTPGASSTTRRSRRYINRDLAMATRTIAGRQRLRHLAVQPLSPRGGVGRVLQLQRAVQRSGAAGVLAAVPAAGLRTAALPERHVHAARRRLRAGDDGLPRVRAAVGQHDAAGLRRRAADRQHAVAADVRRGRALLHAARRVGPAGAARPRRSRARRLPPTSSTSAATPSCAGTTTCSSSATRRTSRTPSCASRSSRRC